LDYGGIGSVFQVGMISYQFGYTLVSSSYLQGDTVCFWTTKKPSGSTRDRNASAVPP